VRRHLSSGHATEAWKKELVSDEKNYSAKPVFMIILQVLFVKKNRLECFQRESCSRDSRVELQRST